MKEERKIFHGEASSLPAKVKSQESFVTGEKEGEEASLTFPGGGEERRCCLCVKIS